MIYRTFDIAVLLTMIVSMKILINEFRYNDCITYCEIGHSDESNFRSIYARAPIFPRKPEYDDNKKCGKTLKIRT